MVFQRRSKRQNKHTHKKKEGTNIWGNVIICPLQMCNDFPCGIVNVNRISRGIITFPQAAEKTQACGYFCSLGLSQSRDTEDPTGERVAHILSCSQMKKNLVIINAYMAFHAELTLGRMGKALKLYFRLCTNTRNSSVRWQEISK